MSTLFVTDVVTVRVEGYGGDESHLPTIVDKVPIPSSGPVDIDKPVKCKVPKPLGISDDEP